MRKFGNHNIKFSKPNLNARSGIYFLKLAFIVPGTSIDETMWDKTSGEFFGLFFSLKRIVAVNSGTAADFFFK